LLLAVGMTPRPQLPAGRPHLNSRCHVPWVCELGKRHRQFLLRQDPRCGDAAVLLPLRFVLVMSLMENRVEPLDWRSRLVSVGWDISREGRLAQQ
jgi:hypothetical protein